MAGIRAPEAGALRDRGAAQHHMLYSRAAPHGVPSLRSLGGFLLQYYSLPAAAVSASGSCPKLKKINSSPSTFALCALHQISHCSVAGSGKQPLICDDI